MDIEKYFPSGVPDEVGAMLRLTGSPISLEEIWALMDLAWARTRARPDDAQSMERFYSHPVWTLNGIFTETDEASVENRKKFSEAIAKNSPKRIADYGGGFGALSRLLASELPNSIIEIIEPYPSQLARILCEKYKNIIFASQLSGKYDVIIAIDVLEHVNTPLSLAYYFGQHLSQDGYIFLGNCFYPVIKCHLPSTFYLRHTFGFLMKKMGFIQGEKVLYAETFRAGAKLRPPQKIRLWIAAAKIFFLIKNIYHEAKFTMKSILAHEDAAY